MFRKKVKEIEIIHHVSTCITTDNLNHHIKFIF